MLDKIPVIQIDCSCQQEAKLIVNEQQYRIITRGFLVKQQCVVRPDGRVWLRVKKRGPNTFRLLFANGSTYQLEVLLYATMAYVFYDQEDTELFRFTFSSHSPDTICLLASTMYIPEEEFIGLVTWGFYFWRSRKEKRTAYKSAA